MEKPLGVTCGDAGGIGIECFLKAMTTSNQSWPIRLYAQPDHLIAVSDTLEGEAAALGRELATRGETGEIQLIPLDNLERPKPTPGVWNPAWKSVAWDALEQSIHEAKTGITSGVVTLPITKRIVTQENESFPGQTELFATRCGTVDYAMMLAAPELRVVPVTTHIPLAQVSASLTTESIERVIRLTHKTLMERFGLPQPKIAVCGLNPHAGESGLLGSEEETLISPAVRTCEDLEGKILGPIAADTLFPLAKSMGVDGIIAMYHDQGLAPFKTLYFDTGVNTTIGLPVIRTSPDHGVAYGISGTNTANPMSTLCAIQMAWDCALSYKRFRG